MAFDFIEGDIVRLTGIEWDGSIGWPENGTEVKIVGVDESGPWFYWGDLDEDGERDILYVEHRGFGGELVSRGEVDASLLKKGDKVRLVGKHWDGPKEREVLKDQTDPSYVVLSNSLGREPFDYYLGDGWEIEKVAEPEAPKRTQRFNVGDWVKAGSDTFQVTAVVADHGHTDGWFNDEVYYIGKGHTFGIWDRYLEPAVDLDDTVTFADVKLEESLSSNQHYVFTLVPNTSEKDPLLTFFKEETPKTVDAVDPEHYIFPGGFEVRDISQWLTANSAQALQYIARSSRIDGKNKGTFHDAVQDLKKAVRFLEFEIYRLEDSE